MDKPNIVDIPEKMEKFYGKGKMLHPNIDIVEPVINLIPKGKITTIEVLGSKLAADFEVEITCPMRLGNTIKKIAKQNPDLNESPIPYWRIIRTDRLVIKTENFEIIAVKLEEEGFELSFNNKSGNIKVLFDEYQIFSF